MVGHEPLGKTIKKGNYQKWTDTVSLNCFFLRYKTLQQADTPVVLMTDDDVTRIRL